MDKDRLRPVLNALFALGWILVVFVAYVAVHKPFTPLQLTGILLAGWRTLLALALLSIAGGLGQAAGIDGLDLPPLVRAALSAALGLGLIGLCTLLIGSLLGVNALLWVLLLAAAVLLRQKIVVWWACLAGIRRLWTQAGKFSRLTILLLAVLLACQYVVALAPPLQFDALTYHLAIPESFIQMGRIVYLPGTIFWGMPEQAEMVYLPVMALGGPEAATVLCWWIGVVALMGLFGFAEQFFDAESAWVAIAALMCGAALDTALSSGYVEWQTMLFALSMLVCLLLWAQGGARPTLLLAGLFAGMALGTKYTAGIVILAGLVVIVLLGKGFSFKRFAVDLIVFGGAAVLITLPWWLKNFLATANPFYPLLFPAGAMNATRLAQYQWKPLTQDWSRLVLLPWLASILGVDGGEGYSASIGPLLLGLGLPAIILAWREQEPRRRLALRLAASLMLTGFVVWAVASQYSVYLIQSRLYFAIFPAWAILCAAGYHAAARLRLPHLRVRSILAALIALALGFNTFAVTVSFFRSGAFLAALDPGMRESYMENNLGAYQLAMQQIDKLPGNSYVLMLWETRGLECQPKCDNDEVIDRWSSDLAAYHTPAAVIQAWRQQGYTHVLYYRAGADFIRRYDPSGPKPQSWDALSATLGSLQLVQKAGSAYELYALP